MSGVRSGATVERYRIAVSDDVLDDLDRRLRRTRWTAQPEGTRWELGADTAYLRRLAEYWLGSYDWHRTEQRLNSLPNFVADVDGAGVHFVHVRSADPDAMPLLLVHGWPDSYLRFERILPLLTDTFHVVVPSLPGYAFSDPPPRLGLDHVWIGDLLLELMRTLGYSRFMAHGGDWGASVCVASALAAPHRVAALHLTEVPMWLIAGTPEHSLGMAASTLREQSNRWARRHAGYATVLANSPQTIAAALDDSPIGLAAWMVEKLCAWSDCGGEIDTSFDVDTVVDWIMIYWVTRTAGSSARLYHELHGAIARLASGSVDRIVPPCGFALFPRDFVTPTRAAAERWFDVRQWTHMPAGGHFGAFEQPGALADDLAALRSLITSPGFVSE
jgi:pimeloyl-ACP methyl ester carboxylesterase